jgi:ADP-ribose pyrophosphatase
MDRDKDVEIIHRPVVHDGYMRVEALTLRHRLFAGGWSAALPRELVERGHAVGALPYDPLRDAVVLVHQFRVGPWGAGAPDPWLVETVAGIIGPGETAEEVARREAMEEAGCAMTDLLPVCSYYASPGVMSERIDLFVGIADTDGLGGIHGLDHEGEDIEAFVAPLDEALGWIESGILVDAKAIICLQWIAARREGLRRRFGERREAV